MKEEDNLSLITQRLHKKLHSEIVDTNSNLVIAW